jgi:hypothetical protein
MYIFSNNVSPVARHFFHDLADDFQVEFK